MQSGVDQRRFASTRKKKKKQISPGKAKRKARRAAERMDYKLPGQDRRPRDNLLHRADTARVPTVEKGSDVRDIDHFEPLDSQRDKGRKEGFTSNSSIGLSTLKTRRVKKEPNDKGRQQSGIDATRETGQFKSSFVSEMDREGTGGS
jgi:hypothetical protein